MAAGAAQKSRDTKLELAFRSELRTLGLKGYRLQHRINLPPWGRRSQRTTPDVVFIGAKVAVFLDGCYWHGCPACYKETKTNTAGWRTKRAENRARDERHSRALVVDGWRVLRFWEHEDMTAAAAAVQAVLDTAAVPGVYGLSGGNR